MNKIRQWIQDRRDERFRRQMERVFANHKIKASPIFGGYIAATGAVMSLGGEYSNKPLDRIRYEIEHPNPVKIEVSSGGLTPTSQEQTA